MKHGKTYMVNGVSTRAGTSLEAQLAPNADTPSLISTLENGHPDNLSEFRKRKKGDKERSDN